MQRQTLDAATAIPPAPLPARAQALQDQPRMTAATERGVDVLALRIRDERIDRLVQQDRGV